MLLKGVALLKDAAQPTFQVNLPLLKPPTPCLSAGFSPSEIAVDVLFPVAVVGGFSALVTP